VPALFWCFLLKKCWLDQPRETLMHCSSLALVRPELLTRTAYVPALPNRQLIRLHANENPWSIEDVETGDEALQRAVEKLSQSGVKNKSALTASNASNYTTAASENRE